MLNNKYKNLKKDLDHVKYYLSFKVLLKDPNSPLNLEVKESLKKELGKKYGKNISLLKNIFIKRSFNFGNQIAALNNILYYSEVLGIKNIYLNSEYNWYIKNNISTKKIHISLLSPKKVDCNSSETFCGSLYPRFFYPVILKPERRSLILKNEIKRNLPKIKINKKDLYIYIRSGDSFQIHGNCYTPAPYCFYQKVLSNFKFRNIHIISVDDKSPIIRKLLSDYPSIIHKLKPVEEDIAILINARNLVNSLSSFTQASISFNDKLINLFEYEVYKIEQSILDLHYDIDKINRKFNIYRMKPSEDYFLKMYSWENTDEQRKGLFEENCKYDFRKIKYTKTILE